MVLDNVRMAYVNRDQLPIPADTSAEAAVVHVLHNTAQTVGLAGAETEIPFVGSRDISTEPSGTDTLNPLRLLDLEESEFTVALYEVVSAELEGVLSSEAVVGVRAHPEAVLLAITDDGAV